MKIFNKRTLFTKIFSSGEKIEELIDLNFNLGNGWGINQRLSDNKNTVLYYRGPLQSGQYTTNVLNSVSTSPKIYDYYNDTNQNGKIICTYIADGKKFVVECQINTVNDSNFTTSGIQYAWGITYDEYLSIVSY